mmetsp:Transcript_43994/g.113721  ORF Transcript_43994/g.113721 Transcript_43994/m.113721 type:complete len:426 (+) Transcript_43994:349-1626(+)
MPGSFAEARVSPRPTQISIDTAPVSLATTSFEKAMKAYARPAKDTIGCTRTPIATPSKRGIPAAWRLWTARRVNILPQTCLMAVASAFLSVASTPSTESWRPAPETPSRSSLFAEERTATRSVPFGRAAAKSSTTFVGTVHASTAARAVFAHSSILAGLPPFSASVSAATALSTAAPETALRMTPKGTAKPVGAQKPHCFARLSSLPEEAALDPTVEAWSASFTTGSTLSPVRFISPTFFGVALASAEDFFEEPSSRAFASTCSAFAPPLASIVSRTQAPAGAWRMTSSKRGRSDVHAKTTPSCRARSARWLSTGRSRASTTPRQRLGSSSSPPASLQKMIAPSAGSSFVQDSESELRCTTLPQRLPAAMVVQSGRPAARLASCIASCTSFETWKSTAVRISASTKTEIAWPSMCRARPRAGMPS